MSTDFTYTRTLFSLFRNVINVIYENKQTTNLKKVNDAC